MARKTAEEMDQQGRFVRDREPHPRPAPVPADTGPDDLSALWAAVEQLQRSDEREAVMDADEQRRLGLLEAALKDATPGRFNDLLTRLTSRTFWIGLLTTLGPLIAAIQQAYHGNPIVAAVCLFLSTLGGSVYMTNQARKDIHQTNADSALQQAKIAAVSAPTVSAIPGVVMEATALPPPVVNITCPALPNQPRQT